RPFSIAKWPFLIVLISYLRTVNEISEITLEPSTSISIFMLAVLVNKVSGSAMYVLFIVPILVSDSLNISPVVSTWYPSAVLPTYLFTALVLIPLFVDSEVQVSPGFTGLSG